jgi:fructoselysine 6-kinase
MISVVGIGDNTVDRYVDQGIMYPGGNTVNMVVHTSRLGHSSAYFGCLAEDDAGMLIHESLIMEGVDVSCCRLLGGENAFCDIRLVDGDRVFGEFSAGVCDQLIINEFDLAFISTFDLAHTSVYSFMDPYLGSLQSNTRFLSYDFSNEWDRDSLEETLHLIDFALISNSVEDLGDNNDLLKWAVAQGPRLVMATSGEQGAAVFDGKRMYFQPIIPAEEVVDTLGAGDAFAACFLTGYLEGEPIPEALESAALYASETCSHYGAFGHGRKYKKLREGGEI